MVFVLHYLSANPELAAFAAEPTAEFVVLLIAFETLFAAMLVAMPIPPTPPAIAAAGTTLPIKESIGPLLPKLLTSDNCVRGPSVVKQYIDLAEGPEGVTLSNKINLAITPFSISTLSLTVMPVWAQPAANTIKTSATIIDLFISTILLYFFLKELQD
jgi:hypothetical protein